MTQSSDPGHVCHVVSLCVAKTGEGEVADNNALGRYACCSGAMELGRR